MFGVGSKELIILLVIVLLIFGPKNLPRLAQSIGRSLRELKNGLSGLNDEMKGTMKENSSSQTAQSNPTPTNPEDPTVEHNETGDPKNA